MQGLFEHIMSTKCYPELRENVTSSFASHNKGACRDVVIADVVRSPDFSSLAYLPLETRLFQPVKYHRWPLAFYPSLDDLSCRRKFIGLRKRFPLHSLFIWLSSCCFVCLRCLLSGAACVNFCGCCWCWRLLLVTAYFSSLRHCTVHASFPCLEPV